MYPLTGIFDAQPILDDRRLKLRLDYTNLELLSPFAKEYDRVQKDCSIKTLAINRQRPLTGLGSDIHVYSTSMCKAIEMNHARLRTIGSWIWTPLEHCPAVDENNRTISPMLCYFPRSETICPNDHDEESDLLDRVNITDWEGLIARDSCPNVENKYGGTSAIRAATTEVLFTRVADFVVEEAERQLQIHFGNNSRTNNKIPKNLITVHIRWGDKRSEMTLLPVKNYTNAVHMIVQRRQIKDDDVHIYLSTESPDAVEQFMDSIPSHWNVYLDQYFVEMSKDRQGNGGDEYGTNSYLAINSRGRSGIVALGSLLVAMEASDYVLTTASNWSRLMNEIRKNIINPRCNNLCTNYIDLAWGEYR